MEKLLRQQRFYNECFRPTLKVFCRGILLYGVMPFAIYCFLLKTQVETDKKYGRIHKKEFAETWIVKNVFERLGIKFY